MAPPDPPADDLELDLTDLKHLALHGGTEKQGTTIRVSQDCIKRLLDGIRPANEHEPRCGDCGSTNLRHQGEHHETVCEECGWCCQGDTPEHDYDWSQVDVGLPDAYLDAAHAAGAHHETVAFVATYPGSPLADTLRTAISMDALDEFEQFAGSWGGRVWADGIAAGGNPDTANERRIRALFPEDRWPPWMQDEGDA